MINRDRGASGFDWGVGSVSSEVCVEAELSEVKIVFVNIELVGSLDLETLESVFFVLRDFFNSLNLSSRDWNLPLRSLFSFVSLSMRIEKFSFSRLLSSLITLNWRLTWTL